MICKCKCKCTNLAGGQTGAPDLCIECALMSELGRDDIHGLPYVPPKWTPIEPEVKITKEQMDKAVKNWADEMGF